MADPLLGCQPLVARHVAGSGLVSVGSWPAGPAGSAGLDLGGGVALDVAAAGPGRLVGLTIELPSGDPPDALSGGLRRRLDLLLGPGHCDAVVALLRAPARDRLRPATARLTSDGGRSADVRSTNLADPPGDDAASFVAPSLYRAAVAYGVACAPGAPPLVRAVGLLEAAVELAAIGGVLDVDDMVERDLHIGVDLLLDAVAGGSGPAPGKASRAVAGLLRRVTTLTPAQSLAAVRLTSLACEFERGAARAGLHLYDHRLAETPGVRPRPDLHRPALRTADRPRPSGRVPVDVGSLPGALAEAPVAAYCRGAADVEVRIAGWAERRGGLWARTFHVDDGNLLAVAPFRADAGDAVARLLVPPHAIHRLEVDVTDRPELSRPSRALAATQRAIHVGRLAAQAGRLGDLASATQRWRQCARLWSQAGDHERAELALAFGDRATDVLRSSARRPAPARRGPLVVDLVDVGA